MEWRDTRTYTRTYRRTDRYELWHPYIFLPRWGGGENNVHIIFHLSKYRLGDSGDEDAHDEDGGDGRRQVAHHRLDVVEHLGWVEYLDDGNPQDTDHQHRHDPQPVYGTVQCPRYGQEKAAGGGATQPPETSPGHIDSDVSVIQIPSIPFITRYDYILLPYPMNKLYQKDKF